MSEVPTVKRFEFETAGVDTTLGELRRLKTELTSTISFSTQLINTLTLLRLPKELREAVRMLQMLALAANMAAAALEAVKAVAAWDITAAIKSGIYVVNAAVTLHMMTMEY